MKKICVLMLIVFFAGGFIPSVFAQDTLTFSTFYPAPFGAYDRIRLVPRNTPAGTCDATTLGTMYVDATGELQICGNLGWNSVGVWTQNGTDIVPRDGVGQNVGIGTLTPSSKLHVSGGDALFDGDVGMGLGLIGSTDPSAKLQVVGDSSSGSIAVSILGGDNDGLGVVSFNGIGIQTSGTGGGIVATGGVIFLSGTGGYFRGDTGAYGYGITTGVIGESLNANGVIGKGSVGVRGEGATSTGVYGIGPVAGVWGDSANTEGVRGTSGSGYGVAGYASNGGIGVYGVAAPVGVGTAGFFDGILMVTANLFVGDDIQADNLTISNLVTTDGLNISRDLSVGRDADINNDLSVNGTTTSGDLNVNGTATINNLTVTGSLTKPVGSFVQPHPQDPDKEINYVFFEGRDNRIFFDGVTRLKNGEAKIRIPEDFRLVASDKVPLNVILTPFGDNALYVKARSLKEVTVVAREKGDIEFGYLVIAARGGFEDSMPIQENTHFRPDQSKDIQTFEKRFSPVEKDSYYGRLARKLNTKLLVQNGILNQDGTVNRILAGELNWRLKDRPFPGSSKKEQ